MSFEEYCKYNYDICCGKDGDIFYLCLRLKTKITPMNRYTKSTIYLSFLLLFGGVQIPAAVHAQDAGFTPPFDFPITFPETSVKYVPITFMADWISKLEVLSVSRCMPWPKDIFRVSVSHMVRVMCSM